MTRCEPYGGHPLTRPVTLLTTTIDPRCGGDSHLFVATTICASAQICQRLSDPWSEG